MFAWQRVVAILPYTKMPDTDELTFQKGDIFFVHNDMGDGWLWVTAHRYDLRSMNCVRPGFHQSGEEFHQWEVVLKNQSDFFIIEWNGWKRNGSSGDPFRFHPARILLGTRFFI